MKKYIKSRILTGILTIIFAFIMTFFLIRNAPGDPIRVLAGKDNPNPKQIAYLTEKYGLDQPVSTQFIRYIENALKGDFGFSYVNNKAVTKIIGEKIFATILLTLVSSLISFFIGTILGLYAGRKIGSRFDRLACTLSYVLDAIPSFWLGLILILLFSSKLKLLPTSGMYSVRENYSGFMKFLDLLKHMILPVSTLVIIQVPVYFRITRSSVIQVINEDFINTFRATGMKEEKIFKKYVLRNAIIPVITTFSLSLAFMISGASLVEIVFSWPGMGRVIMDAIHGRDYPVLTGIYLIISISVTVFMIITDIIYALVDPRIRLE